MKLDSPELKAAEAEILAWLKQVIENIETHVLAKGGNQGFTHISDVGDAVRDEVLKRMSMLSPEAVRYLAMDALCMLLLKEWMKGSRMLVILTILAHMNPVSKEPVADDSIFGNNDQNVKWQ